MSKQPSDIRILAAFLAGMGITAASMVPFAGVAYVVQRHYHITQMVPGGGWGTDSLISYAGVFVVWLAVVAPRFTVFDQLIDRILDAR